ncbi:formyltransferase [Propionivibrio dicarboxylicus]|uniref:Methionyl-tRNA formyltransferase n=1 Tax=Propionivibrio dicarboxylicus TaxID=83767 RepID=A0A1G8MPM7_9RHOO|nr:formyltransferase [Propionivibrio dicarboxylicus]SDI69911.1 methionyl-tRNA formyltransferase [Propionivibrio dicarboxylicus]
MTRAVVFAYHNVGVRCLKVLLARGIDVALVITHEDNPNENIWFGSVRQVCEENDIPFITPADPNTPETEACVAALDADFLFSFYYRHMLKAPLLSAVKRGAYNMHGSLLPKYRGRVPINWAVIHGERETGATLHRMTEKPDNGAIVDQVAVPILPDDTAQEVFEKVTVAAELCLHRALPGLIDGSAPHRAQDLSQGAYFGGRKAEDGRIDWSQNARQIHDLVRAVTRPYPGAFSDLPTGRLVLWRTRVVADDGTGPLTGTITHNNGILEIHPIGGGILQILDAELSGGDLPTSGNPDDIIKLPSSDS